MGRTRGLIQAWAAASSVLFAILALAIAGVCALAFFDPERFRMLCLEGSEVLAQLPGAFSGPRPTPLDPEESQSAESREDAAPAPESGATQAEFESRVEKLESDVALLRAIPGTAPLAERSRIALSRLEAWESLREPIFRLLECFSEEGPSAALPDSRADIRTIAGELGSRMERAARLRREMAGRLARGLSAGEFLRLALDERVLPTAQAAEYFFLLSPAEASRVLGRLALMRPELGARIVRDLSGVADAERKTVVEMEK